jgi:hypothetical protein
VVWKADLVFVTGDRVLNNEPISLYSQRIDADMFKADNPSLTPIDVDPLPADHPILKATSGVTPTSGFSDINNVKADTVKKLFDFGFDATDKATHALLSNLSVNEASAVSVLADEALGGRVDTNGFKNWLERLKTDRLTAAKEGRLAQKELESDASAKVTFDADGKVLLSGGRRGTVEVPVSVVDHVKRIAGNETELVLKPYEFDKAARPAIVSEVRQAAADAGEKAYMARLAEPGATDADAKLTSEKATRAGAQQAAEAVATRVARDRANAAIASGSAFGKGFTSAKQLADYRAGTTGMAAKRLASSLPGKTEKSFLDAMQDEVKDGKVPAPRSININGPPAQTMQMWEYADGTEVRYKPLGDADRPNKPTFSIEVKKDPTVPDMGKDDAAFKIDAAGNPVPKNDLEIDNPYDKSRRPVQHDAFETAVLDPVHFELK